MKLSTFSTPKTIQAVILTKSFMQGGFCVTGIDIKDKKLVRFVSNAAGDSIQLQSLKYYDETECSPLDVVAVKVTEHAPIRHQTENYVIADSIWRKIGSMTIGYVMKKYYPSGENHPYIFANAFNYLTEEQLQSAGLDHSLMVADVTNLNITYTTNAVNKVKAMADFSYKGKQYQRIRITDPEYVTRDWQSVSFPEAYIVMSLAKDGFNVNGRQHYYKFAAKIFPLQNED